MKKTSRLRLRKKQVEDLAKAAAEAAKSAYAPYSNFPVGAAVLGASGRTYLGANVENACYGLGICAERVALSAAKMNMEEAIVAIAVACVKADAKEGLEGKMPCGACRQWMVELAPEAEVYIVGTKQHFKVAQLLPKAFRLK